MATIRVPADQPTLAQAVRNARSGDTIVVAASYGGNETVDVGVDNLTIDAPRSVPGLIIRLANGANSVNIAGDVELNVFGTSGADTITGNAGINYLQGRGGDDTLNGVSGTDWAMYFNAPSAVQVTLTDGPGGVTGGFSRGGDGNDTLINIDSIGGSNFNDTLTGNSAGNFLLGQRGDDTLDGRGGDDTADYFNAAGGVQVTLTDGASGGPTGGFSRGADGNDTLINIESIRGSRFDDTLTGNSGSNFLNGRAGNDTLDGQGAEDFADYINAAGVVRVTLTDGSGGQTGGFSSGADGNDTLINIEHIRGGAFNDILTGNGGVNFLRGGLGNDTLDGQGGNDYADYLNAASAVQVTLTDGVSGGPAGGFSSGADGNDTLINIESVRGSRFGDTLIGNSGANFLRGDLGDDNLDGRGGQDYADYRNAAGAVTATLTDGVAGGPTGGFSSGADGNDTFIDIENIQGGAHSDTFTGNSGDNIFSGRGGNDVIDGGGGTDTVTFLSVRSNYQISRYADGRLSVVDTRAGSPDGADSLRNVETLRFSDGDVAASSVAFQAVTAAQSATPISKILGGVTTAGLADLQAKITKGELALGELVESLIVEAQLTSVPVLLASAVFGGATPSEARFPELAAFAKSQLDAYSAMQVAQPALGPYEALGLGFSETLPFQAKYGNADQASFVAAAYLEIFGRAATSSQQDHFSSQLAFFASLYQSAGQSEANSLLHAKGAVAGQMLGFAVLSEVDQHRYDDEANNFLRLAAEGKAGFGDPLSFV